MSPSCCYHVAHLVNVQFALSRWLSNGSWVGERGRQGGAVGRGGKKRGFDWQLAGGMRKRQWSRWWWHFTHTGSGSCVNLATSIRCGGMFKRHINLQILGCVAKLEYGYGNTFWTHWKFGVSFSDPYERLANVFLAYVSLFFVKFPKN